MRMIVTIIVAGLAVVGCTDRAKIAERTAPSATAAAADPWSAVGVGTVFETKTVTRMEQPFVHESETTTRQTLLAKNDSEVSVRLEVAGASHEIKVPLRPEPAQPCTASTVTTTAADTCIVPAGTFDCTRTTIEVHKGETTSSSVTWMATNIPVPIKSVVTNENMTTTTELTRLARR